MKSFLGDKSGRIFLLHLSRGDELLKSIKAACREHSIETGIVVSGIGSLQKTVYRYPGSKSEEPEDVYVTVNTAAELVSLQGIILEGEPHLHALVTESGSTAHGGHVAEGCEVLYLAEIAIIEADNLPVGRRAEKYGTVTHFVLID